MTESAKIFFTHRTAVLQRPAKGHSHAVESVPTGGEGPRGFALNPTGQLLLVGNQKSNNLGSSNSMRQRQVNAN